MQTPVGIPADPAALAAFCGRWSVSRLWLFGSLARGDARPDSNADLLLELAPDATTSTWDFPQMSDQLRAIFGRRVDILTTCVLRNPYRAKSILSTRKLLYAA